MTGNFMFHSWTLYKDSMALFKWRFCR